MASNQSSNRVITVTLEDQGKTSLGHCEYVMPIRVGSGPYRASWRHGPPRRFARDRDLEVEAQYEIGKPDPTRCPNLAVGRVGQRAYCKVHLKIEQAKAEKRARPKAVEANKLM